MTGVTEVIGTASTHVPNEGEYHSIRKHPNTLTARPRSVMRLGAIHSGSKVMTHSQNLLMRLSMKVEEPLTYL